MRSVGVVRRLSLLVCLLLLVSILGYGEAGKKVLLIFSYHPEHPWHVEEARGAEEVLQGEGITFESFYMDTKRNTSAEWRAQAARDAEEKIEEFNPDLVIVLDDNACELVAKNYIGESLPFVFCGMNADPSEYGFPAENITGVLERHHVRGSIELLQQLVPNVQTVAFITDASPSAQAFLERLEDTSLPVEISEIYTTNDFSDWQVKVEELQSEVDAIGLLTYHTIKRQGKEESMSPDEVLRWTLDNSRLPEFDPLDFAIRGGALCGVVLSGYEQGRTAAEMAVRILAGERPMNIPIISPEAGHAMINARRAAELAELGLEIVEIIR